MYGLLSNDGNNLDLYYTFLLGTWNHNPIAINLRATRTRLLTPQHRVNEASELD